MWPDKVIWDIPELLCQDLASLLAPPAAGSCPAALAIFFEGQHSVSHGRVRVMERKDRQLLVSLKEGDKQVCQVVVEWFVTKAAAAAFMVKLAEQYCADKIARADLITTRNTMLREAGVQARTQPARMLKRPAEATTTALKRPAANTEDVAAQQDMRDAFRKEANRRNWKVGALQEPQGSSTSAPAAAPSLRRGSSSFDLMVPDVPLTALEQVAMFQLSGSRRPAAPGGV